MHASQRAETAFADVCCTEASRTWVEAVDVAAVAAMLMQSRRTILPKRLFAPGPNAQQTRMLFEAAATAPDHGQLLPWRLIVIPEDARESLATVFGAALLERDPAATPGQIESARDKARRGPLLLLVVVDGGCGDASIDLAERIVSAGCAIQNILLTATAMCFGSAITSGKALKSRSLRALFRLGAADQALCFVTVGTAERCNKARTRPTPNQFVSTLNANSGLQPGFC